MRDRFTKTSKTMRGHIPQAVRKEIYAKDEYTCVFCQQCFPRQELTIDHLMPVSKSGLHEPANFVTACKTCNQKKADKPLIEFLSEIGIQLADLPVHLDPVLADAERLPEDYISARKQVFEELRSGKLRAANKSSQKKIEKEFRAKFWQTGEGQRLQLKFPNLPGHVRIMVPQIQQLAKSKGDALLLIELAKSAKTRNLIGGHLDSVGDLRSHFQQLQHRTSDEQLRKKIAQAFTRLEGNL